MRQDDRHSSSNPFGVISAKPIVELLDRLKDLPLLPGGIAKLLSLNASDPSFLEVACSIIRGDPALTAQILKLANSVQFGGQSAVTTVEKAFMRVGSRMIAATLAEGQVLRIFNVRDPTIHRLWCMSSLAGSLGYLLAERRVLRDIAPETAYTYGLLHDVGYLIYVTLNPGTGSALVDFCVDSGGPSIDAEREILGVSHTVIGQMAAKQWRFPSDLELMIAAHHGDHRQMRDLDQRSRDALDLISLVNALVFTRHKSGFGSPFTRDELALATQNAPAQRAFASLCLNLESLELVIGIAERAVEEKRHLLGLPETQPPSSPKEPTAMPHSQVPRYRVIQIRHATVESAGNKTSAEVRVQKADGTTTNQWFPVSQAAAGFVQLNQEGIISSDGKRFLPLS